jgi:hypothetical protein
LKIQWLRDVSTNSTTKTASFPLTFTSRNSYCISVSITARVAVRVVKNEDDTGCNTFKHQTDSSSTYHIDVIGIGY